MGFLKRSRAQSGVARTLDYYRKNAGGRKNISLTPSEERKKGNYVDPLVKKKYNDFYNIKHRYGVCKYDPTGKKLTYGFAKKATAKTFKFYSSHEVDGVEVMKDQRARWVELGCNSIFRKAVVPFIRDGFVLLNLRDIKKNGVLENVEYDVYGEYECPPTLWSRIANKIVLYRVQYTPHPRAFGTSVHTWSGLDVREAGAQLSEVNKTLKPKEVIHIECGEPNWGYGDSQLEGWWDCLVKLRETSHMEMIDRRLVPQLELSGDDYDKEHTRGKALLKMIADSDLDTARLCYKDVLPDGTISELPRFSLKSPSADTARTETKGIRAADYGNISSEWGRLCTATGHTIHYFFGNRAGAVTGSETDQEDDIIQEIIDFGMCEVIIRKILDWLAEKGLITLPSEKFVIKYWKDWEHIESTKAREEAMKEMPEKGVDKEVESSDIVDSTTGTKENEDTPIQAAKNLQALLPKQKTVIRYKQILHDLDTQTKIKNAGKEIGWSMGNGTAEKFIKVMQNQREKAYKRVHRRISLNAEAFGNSIKEMYPLFYYENGVIVEEYICPLAWKKNVGKTVPLGVYHDFWGGVELPDWQIVGNAEVFGWDEEEGEDFVKFDYDYDKIDNVFKELDYYDWLSPLLKENKTADISTAYYCDIEERYNEQLERTIRYQVNIELVSISFVPAGNCPGDVCKIQETKSNADDLNNFINSCVLDGDGNKQECIEKAYYAFKPK